MNRFTNPLPQYILETGKLAVGGMLHLYVSKSDDYVDLYADDEGTQTLANPVELGSRGEVPNIFYEGSIRAVLFDAAGNQLFDVDPVQPSSGGQGGFTLYNGDIDYDKKSIVLGSNGRFYMSEEDNNRGNDPTDSPSANPFWSEVDILRRWNSLVTYSQTEFVLRGTALYYSVSSGNQGNDPSIAGSAYWRSVADALNVIYNNAASGLVATNAQTAISELKALIDSVTNSLTYRGVLDVSAGDAALPTVPSNSDLYVIGVGGTITVSVGGLAPSPVLVAAGQQIVYNTASTRWDLIPTATNASSVAYNNLTSSMAATDVQLAIDELDERADGIESDVASLQVQINGHGSAFQYLGALDVSAGDSALPLAPAGGDLYNIAIGGTITVSVLGATPIPTLVTVGQQVVYNDFASQWDLTPSTTQAGQVSYNNNTSGLSATTVQGAVDELNAGLIKPETINASSGINRTGEITDVTKTGTSNVTYTVVDADFAVDDVIRIRKCKPAGSMTIVTTLNQEDPNGVLDTESQFGDGDAGCVELIRLASSWALRVSA